MITLVPDVSHRYTGDQLGETSVLGGPELRDAKARDLVTLSPLSRAKFSSSFAQQSN